jgi:hypothetical protein
VKFARGAPLLARREWVRRSDTLAYGHPAIGVASLLLGLGEACVDAGLGVHELWLCSRKTSVITGRKAPRPRNTTPSPYPALCRAGSRDGQFGGNALGHACSLTFATADITTQQAHPKRRPRVSKRHAFPTHLGCGTDVRSSDVHVGTRLGAKLPGPQPPQEYVDDLRGSFSPFRESGSGASSCPMIVA